MIGKCETFESLTLAFILTTTTTVTTTTHSICTATRPKVAQLCRRIHTQ